MASREQRMAVDTLRGDLPDAVNADRTAPVLIEPDHIAVLALAKDVVLAIEVSDIIAIGEDWAICWPTPRTGAMFMSGSCIFLHGRD